MSPPALEAHSGVKSRTTYWTVFAALLAWQLLAYVLPRPPVMIATVDEGWRQFLGLAFLQGKQFGIEVIFTYGPWGFLLEPRQLNGLYPYLVLGRLILAAGIAAGISLLAVQWIVTPVYRLLYVVPVLLLADPSYLLPVIFMIVACVACEERSHRIALVLLAISVGLVANTKFTATLLTVCCMIPILWRRHTRIFAGTAALAFVVFWMLAGQRLSTLPSYLSMSLHLSSGYSRSMEAGPAHGPLLTVLSLTLILLFVILALCWTYAQWSPPVALAGVGLAACAFLLYKHTIVRQDPEHVFMAAVAGAIPLCWTLMPLVFRPARTITQTVPASHVITAAVVLTSGFVVVGNGYYVMDRTMRYVRAAAGLDATDRAATTRPAQDSLKPGDVFPSDLSYAFQQGIPLRNRPVIQGYAAFAPLLTQMNAEFLQSARAPERVYFTGAPIDVRYATTEDSLSWRSLLTHYEPVGVNNSALVLARRSSAADLHPQLIMDRVVTAGTGVDIPHTNGEPVWAEIDFRPTMLSPLFTAAYRGRNPVVAVETTQRVRTLSLIADTSRTGFLLSPYVETPLSFADLYYGSRHVLDPERVTRISFRRDLLTRLQFKDAIRVRLYRMRVPSTPLNITTPEMPEMLRSAYTKLSGSTEGFEARIQAGEVRLFHGLDTRATLRLKPGARQLTFRHGYVRRANQLAAAGLNITWHGTTGQTKTVLDAGELCTANTEPRIFDQTVDISGLSEGELVFSTRTQQKTCEGLQSFWTAVSLN